MVLIKVRLDLIRPGNQIIIPVFLNENTECEVRFMADRNCSVFPQYD